MNEKRENEDGGMEIMEMLKKLNDGWIKNDNKLRLLLIIERI